MVDEYIHEDDAGGDSWCRLGEEICGKVATERTGRQDKPLDSLRRNCSGNHGVPVWSILTLFFQDQVVRFPYGVLEVKLQTQQPSWVSSILLYEPVSSSKYPFRELFAFML